MSGTKTEVSDEIWELLGQYSPEAVGGDEIWGTIQVVSGTWPKQSSKFSSSSAALKVGEQSESPSLPISA